MAKFGKKSLNNLAAQGLDVRIVIFCTAFLLKHPDYDISVVETMRTLAQQKINVAKGTSWTLESKHLVGKAVDLYPVGWREFTEKDWTLWTKRGEKVAEDLGLPIKCGGSLWGKDFFHFELRD